MRISKPTRREKTSVRRPSRKPRAVATAERRGLRDAKSFPIVGVGASAGGLEAFTQLLAGLPLDSGMAFVLVQHLDPDHESQLAAILSRATKLKVREITRGETVKPNAVYVIPRDRSLTIARGVFNLTKRPPTRVQHCPINMFFESLALDRGARAFGVVLSGTATDGTLGLEAIKAEGGFTFAQDASAKYDSMPRSAVAAGCVDLVLSPAKIAEELTRIARHPLLARGAESDTALPSDSESEDAAPMPPLENGKDSEDGYKKVLLQLRNHSGVDFLLYKTATIRRRIHRRMVLSRHDTLHEYADFLRGRTEELDELYADVLINVTSFFRNPETFALLAQNVLPELLKARTDDPLRFWVLGCSTGQEAYSLAMLFVEAVEKAPRMRQLQIFATDLNDALLEKARHGLYAKSVVDEISPQRLRRFFVEEAGGYRINKSLREMVVFARQNLIADPPFSRMDLVSCRNLLIYLDAGVQKKAIPTFHYALKPGGYLLLGASESVSSFAELFEPLDKRHKIYVKKVAPIQTLGLPMRSERRNNLPRSARPPLLGQRIAEPDLPEGVHSELDAQREADRITVNQFAPPAVLINGQLQVLQFRGPTGAFLQPPVGKASFDVLKMAREGLMLPLRSAIIQARKSGKAARKDKIRVKRGGKFRTVNLEVFPLRNLRELCFLILFEDAEKHGAAEPAAPPSVQKRGGRRDDAQDRVAELETELAEMREYLQALQEQHEAAHEEVQSANEEVQSANEELQSINEELETSKEELESGNEELTTVNEEMSSRNIELARLNNDFGNLQASTKQAIVLFGSDLSLRSFSPQAEKQFDLSAADVGRPLNQIRHHLVFADRPDESVDLHRLCDEVVTEVREQEHEVRDRHGRWFSLRLRPYLTQDKKVDGAVLVLVDISILKRNDAALRISEQRYRLLFDSIDEAFCVIERVEGRPNEKLDFRYIEANPAFATHAGVSGVVGKTIRQAFPGEPEEWFQTYDTICRTGEPMRFERDLRTHGRILDLYAFRIEDDSHRRVAVIFKDITEHKRLQSEIARSSSEIARSSSEAAYRRDEFVAMLGHELRNPLSALSNGLELMGKIAHDQKRAEDLRAMMMRQTQRIGALLDQLLDIARIVSNKVEIEKHLVDLTYVARNAVETVKPLIDDHRHHLELVLLPENTALVLGDAVRLTQVVENLLANAAKYTPTGGRITLTLKAHAAHVAIHVRDDGTGMSAELLPHIFEVFTQAPRTLERAQGGLGLGLPLVKRMVELHGGRVEVKSAGHGEGSEFIVSLPRAHAPALESTVPKEDSRAIALPKAQPRRILVVDDEKDAGETLADLLADSGHQTHSVTSGKEALAALASFAPEVVLLDIGLPEMDGYEVAKRLRKAQTDTPLLLIAVTGYRGDSTRLRDAGFDHHLIKPPDEQKLSALLADWDKKAATV